MWEADKGVMESFLGEVWPELIIGGKINDFLKRWSMSVHVSMKEYGIFVA